MATNMKKKTERVAANKEKRPYAVAKYIRVSPYKVRTVLALIRGKSYKEAKAILDYSVNGSAVAVKKVLMSAAANAEQAARIQGPRSCDFEENEPHHRYFGC